MQTLRAFVTLLPMIACASAPKHDANWAQISFAAGDKVEAQSSLDALSKSESFQAHRIAMRLGLRSKSSDPTSALAGELGAATAERSEAIGRAHSELRRAAVYRLLQLGEAKRAHALAVHPALRALAAQLAGEAQTAQEHLHLAASEHLPPLWALRAARRQQMLLLPKPSDAARSAWQALKQLKAPGEALRRAAQAPKKECLRAIVEGLAYEELGRSASSAEAFAKSDCLEAKIQQARVLARLRPAAARIMLQDLQKQAPFNRSLLMGLRRLYPSDSAEGVRALELMVAWHPEDHQALRDRLTQLERDKNWGSASALCERSLQVAYSDELHLLALRYLALAGARHPRAPKHALLQHRLDWLRKRRPGLSAMTQIDALIAGADEEGGALGAARIQLKSPKAGPMPDVPATAGESPR